MLNLGKKTGGRCWSLACTSSLLIKVWSYEQPFSSGHATICLRERRLLVDNLSKGFDLYDLPRSSPSYTFAVPGKKRCVKVGVFGEDSSIIACGSDHGKIYIFSTASPVPLQIMGQSSRWIPIQALDVSSTITIILGNWPRAGCDYCGRPLHRKWKFGCVVWYHYLGEKGECFVIKWGQRLMESRLRKLTCLKKKTRFSTELAGR